MRIGIWRERFMQNLNNGVARLGIKLCAPKLFKPPMSRRIGYRLIVGEHHGD